MPAPYSSVTRFDCFALRFQTGLMPPGDGRIGECLASASLGHASTCCMLGCAGAPRDKSVSDAVKAGCAKARAAREAKLKAREQEAIAALSPTSKKKHQAKARQQRKREQEIAPSAGRGDEHGSGCCSAGWNRCERSSPMAVWQPCIVRHACGSIGGDA